MPVLTRHTFGLDPPSPRCRSPKSGAIDDPTRRLWHYCCHVDSRVIDRMSALGFVPHDGCADLTDAVRVDGTRWRTRFSLSANAAVFVSQDQGQWSRMGVHRVRSGRPCRELFFDLCPGLSEDVQPKARCRTRCSRVQHSWRTECPTSVGTCVEGRRLSVCC